MVIMKNIDSIFTLHTPSIVYYGSDNLEINTNKIYTITSEETLLNKCKTPEDYREIQVNGGVLLIKPNKVLFEVYKRTIPVIAQNKCKYPNEALFEYVNPTFYNLPVRYNLSHYHTLKLNNYNMEVHDVLVYHFNETEYKHLDIIKDNWIPNMEGKKKYEVKIIPVKYFNKEIYQPYHNVINDALHRVKYPVVPQSVVPQSVVPQPKTESKWTKYISKKHNTPYWFNSENGESVWEEPAELKGKSGGSRKTKKIRNNKQKNKRNKRNKTNKKTKQ